MPGSKAFWPQYQNIYVQQSRTDSLQEGWICMEGEIRRNQLAALLSQSEKPISGSELAKHFMVSRQVIVQDIALLRASSQNILSTNKGYLFRPTEKGRYRRTLCVCHNDSQMEEELNLIVDNGARVLDVIVEHEVYGPITVDLLLENRRDVQDFLEKLHSKTAHPLSILTEGKHYHTIEAYSEEILDRIEKELRHAGFLL